jgi:hypothetical protein
VAIGAGWTASPSSGTVPANSKTSITITPPKEGYVTAGTLNDVTATVTTDIPGDSAHSYPMNGTVDGANLAFLNANGAPQPTLAFGSERATGTGATTLQNSGNAAAAVDYVITPDPGNTDLIARLIITFNGSTGSPNVANVGANTIVYSYDGSGLPCFITMTYTVTFPNTSVAGVCGSTTQVVTVTPSNGC